MAAKKVSKGQDAENPPNFEEAMARLETIVRSIEQGEIGLEESIEQYQKGMTLIGRCRSILSDAEAKIQKLDLADDGTLTPSPMDPPKESDA